MATTANGGATPAKRIPETGHARNVASMGTLAAFVSTFDPQVYNPSRTALSLTALQELCRQAQEALNYCKHSETAFDNAIDLRRKVFRNLLPLSLRVIGALKSSDVDDLIIEGAMTINRKLQGRPATVKKKDAMADGEEAVRNISGSQRSYVQLVQHFSGLRELVGSQPEYQPNVPELVPTQLMAFQQQMLEATTGIDVALSQWSNSRMVRNKLLYAPHGGLVDIAAAVKEYVKSAFGPGSTQYQQVKGIRFRNNYH